MEKLLSLCMIVKNEEKVLERCLDSVRDLVDEIIIVDTGSTDSTKEIARKYTDHIYDFVWINDFSAARNKGIAKATGKWILIMDADEYIEQADVHNLREMLINEEPRADVVLNIKIISFTGDSLAESNILESTTDRIFPNHMGILFNRPIHEQLVSIHSTALNRYPISFRIYHTGYLKEVLLEKNKTERNMAIFDQMKKEGKFTAYDYFTLANEYHSQKDFKKSAYYYQRGFSGCNPNFQWYIHCLAGLISSLFNSGSIKEAWDLVESKLSQYINYPEYHCIRAIFYEYFGLFSEAKSEYEEALLCSERLADLNKDAWIISPDYGSKLPQIRLKDLHYRERDIEKTVYYLTKLLMNDSNDMQSLIKLCELLALNETTESIAGFLNKVYSDDNPRHISIRLQTFLAIGHLQLTELYIEKARALKLVQPLDEMRLSLLINDRAAFDLYLKEIPLEKKDSDKFVKHLLLASLIWETTAYIEQLELAENHTYYNEKQLLIALLQHLTYSQKDSSTDVSSKLLLLLTDLFTLQQFEAYDRLVNQIGTPALVNQLANYFYNKNQIDLSMNYYSLLLDQNELNGLSAENLAYYHINQRLYEDAVEFLKYGVEKEPQKVYLHVLLCKYCTIAEERSRYKQNFEDSFPKDKMLPFIQSL
ncbi:glycosyltransferase [Paenibacillus sp. CGMCC 1.16610]|uniref:Glycosyltransferase n=1 Tax=Paenibacillus anseongense TaxID=2682845 RepID=A0ABW9U7Y9_9BACL|nr:MULTISPECIES: TPR domain-containing glycosyltransferase [Paenibacillus]MBA2942390.1 glycosyltransferase [Paenibacillus sp. CGMCC 1.16610]MVQ34465.1 glycosyltransferase [Paenibacillus anseongense]